MPLKKIPNLLYSDAKGKIFDEPSMEMAGRSGFDFVRMKADDFIELPEGSELFELPGRKAIGFDKTTGEKVVYENGIGVAAFISPAHTQLYLAAFIKNENAPTLPLFAYTAVGWLNGKYYVPAVRIDPDIRQDCEQFNHEQVKKNAKVLLKKYPNNRLVQHLVKNCALTYFCPAARNFVLNRWECPIPSSPACNANCVGCISFQPQEETIPATQDRLTFRPTVEEIVEFAVEHLETAERPIVSFGQGCEGEPLLMHKVLAEAIKEIRKQTKKGIININTNGSMPDAVEELCRAGLNSIRVSTNSVRPNIYHAYYRPNNYSFDALAESIKIVRKNNGWASINYFTFPGMTDGVEEYEALRKFISDTDLTMIQWRNFNIDPDWYLERIGIGRDGKFSVSTIGVKNVMNKIKKEFPYIAYGYFNPPKEVMLKYFEKREKQTSSI